LPDHFFIISASVGGKMKRNSIYIVVLNELPDGHSTIFTERIRRIHSPDIAAAVYKILEYNRKFLCRFSRRTLGCARCRMEGIIDKYLFAVLHSIGYTNQICLVSFNYCCYSYHLKSIFSVTLTANPSLFPL